MRRLGNGLPTWLCTLIWRGRRLGGTYAVALGAHLVDQAGHEAGTPTAVAYSLLDLVAPAVDHGTDYYMHWVLTHFLLDGHHKFEAAAASGRPVRLLSLLDVKLCLATPEWFEQMIEARARPRACRVAPAGS